MSGGGGNPKTNDIDKALARSTAYSFLSDVSFYPRLGGGTSGPGSDTRAELEAASAALSGAGYDVATLAPIVELSGAVSRANAGQLESEYVRIFGHTISKQCPPYESEYGSRQVFDKTDALADLAGFYRAFGVEVRQGAGERADHIGIELEFMHVLTYKEAYALSQHGADRADLCREAQKKFLRDHLGTWVDDFVTRLAKRAGSGPYALYAEALRRYIAAELAYIGVVPASRKTLGPAAELSEPPACSVVSCVPPSSREPGEG